MVALVACVKSKRPTAELAQDLYTSSLFRKSRRYAEMVSDRWFILSAKQGLLDPMRITEPYELTLKGMPRDQRDAWALRVVSAVRREVAHGSCLVMLAGSAYLDPLKPLLEASYRVEEPMAGLGLGRRLRWLIEHSG